MNLFRSPRRLHVNGVALWAPRLPGWERARAILEQVRNIGAADRIFADAGLVLPLRPGNILVDVSAITASSPAEGAAKPLSAIHLHNDSFTPTKACSQVVMTRELIDALTDQGLLTAGTTAIKASVDQVQTNFDAVKTAAKDDYHSQVTDLQDALQQLQTAVGNLGTGDAAANLLAVGKAVTATGAAAEDLFTQLKTACGS